MVKIDESGSLDHSRSNLNSKESEELLQKCLSLENSSPHQKDLLQEILRLKGEKRLLEQTVDEARRSTVLLLAACEEAQEGVSNRLLREIGRLKREQATMWAAVEAEEAQLVGALERRMLALRCEKVDIENALEQEQERIVNNLRRQMEQLKVSLSLASGGESLQYESADQIVANFEEQNSSLANFMPKQQRHETILAIPTSECGSVCRNLFAEKEAALVSQISGLMEENNRLLYENVQLKNQLRRQSLDRTSLTGLLPSNPNTPPSEMRDSPHKI